MLLVFEILLLMLLALLVAGASMAVVKLFFVLFMEKER